MINVILASKSPRRKEIFSSLAIPVTVITADTDESYEEGLSPGEIVQLLARKKCRAVLDLLRAEETLTDGTMIVAADTVVACGGEIMGKPKDEADAARMLRLQSDGKNQVYTGIAVWYQGRLATADDHTDVWFGHLSDQDIAAYIATGEPMDKAGAYGIQEKAAFFAQRIDGDFSTVVGFPVYRFGRLVKEEFGISPFELVQY